MQRTIHVLACSHGTDHPEGRRLIDQLRAQVAELLTDRQSLPGWRATVHEAYVDVQQPDLDTVLRGLPEGEPAVVLPLLLSVGFHTSVDIAEAVAARPDTIAAAPIGADPRLAEVMARRLSRAGHLPGDTVVLAAAGTRIPAGQDQARESARLLGEALGQHVTAAFCSAAEPRVDQAIAAIRRERQDARAGVASYLLAPGFFQERLERADANYVTAPLLPDVMIAECVAARLEEALSEDPFDRP